MEVVGIDEVSKTVVLAFANSFASALRDKLGSAIGIFLAALLFDFIATRYGSKELQQKLKWLKKGKK